VDVKRGPGYARDVRVLAIDTTNATGSVALVEVGNSPWTAEIVGSAAARVSNAHGESLMPLVELVLRTTGASLADVDLLAVGIGPGSFTGTRIGVATAKGLAIGARKPLLGVDAFEALGAAARAKAGTEIAVAIDARKGEVYLAVAEAREADVARITEPLHARPIEAWGRLGHPRLPSFVVGDGVALVPELAPLAVLHVGIDVPSAASVGALAGARRARQPDAADGVDLLEPLYVRPPDVTVPKKPPGIPSAGR
jgi:tRNA threonylcarbamoyladenosine biosynthesis protein TsaB